MSADSSVHPADKILQAYRLGQLDHAKAERIHRHLANCEDCRLKLDEASSTSMMPPGEGQGSTPVPKDSALVRPSKRAKAVSDLPPELANHPHYQIIGELGRGGMGVVYLARNRLMERDEVLKVVSQSLLENPTAVERFLREIRTAAKLQHPNVVAAYVALQVGSSLALAMEYVNGEDLKRLIKHNGILPVREACFYVAQAALGLQHAHEKGMVHRDIKPSNLILTQEGKKMVVKILDFGLSKATAEKAEDFGLTGAGKMLGTPEYMAPEQILDATNADIRADLYSLGCTLYYLLTGKPPFRAKSLYELLRQHQEVEPRPLNEVREDVPEALAEVAVRMIAKDPDDRYQTPREVAKALSAFVKQGGSSPEKSGKLLLKPRKPVAGKKYAVEDDSVESDASSVPPRPRKKRRQLNDDEFGLHFEKSGVMVEPPSQATSRGFPAWGWMLIVLGLVGIVGTTCWVAWKYRQKMQADAALTQVEVVPLEREFAYLPDDATSIEGLDYSTGLRARSAWRSKEESFAWGIAPGWFQATGLSMEDASLKLQAESDSATVYVMRFKKPLERSKIINAIHGREFKEADKRYYEGEIRWLPPEPAAPKNPKELPVPAPSIVNFKISIYFPLDDDSLLVMTEDRPSMKKVLSGFTGKPRFSTDLQTLAKWSAVQGTMWRASVHENAAEAAESGGLKGFAIALALHGASLDFSLRFAFVSEKVATKGMATIKDSITERDSIPWGESLSEKQKRAWEEAVRKGAPKREGPDIYLNVSTSSE